MEVLGAVASGITLAALFKCTFEALDVIHLYQSQDVDFKRLQLQYSLEKCRLYNWGVEMGLSDDSKQNLLNEWHSKELVAEALRQIIGLFSDAQVVRKKYGCDDTTSEAAPSLPAPEALHGITRAFDHFRMPLSKSDESMSRLKKTKWVIRDRKKFIVLVSELRSLIDSLEKITNELATTARLEEFLRIRINGITNVDTLLGIASVWKDSHPRVASAASTKADSISMASARQEFISDWQNSVDSEASGDTLIADIEDLTITELKHSVISSKREIEKLKMSLDSTAQSIVSLQQEIRGLEFGINDAINDANLTFFEYTGFYRNFPYTRSKLAQSYSDPVPWRLEDMALAIWLTMLVLSSIFIDQNLVLAIALVSVIAATIYDFRNTPSIESFCTDSTKGAK